MKPGTAILYQAYVSTQLRCLCPVCLTLDARYPNEGYQLALFPYRTERNALKVLPAADISRQSLKPARLIFAPSSEVANLKGGMS